MREFSSGQGASVVHQALKSAVQAMEAAKKNAVLWFGEVLDRKLYQELGYSTMNQYARAELGFSDTKTGDFMNICRKLKKLPRIQEGLRTGELGYTTVRVLTQVADQENEEAWVNQAKTSSRRDLEGQVQKAKKKAAEKPKRQLALMPDPEPVPEASPQVRVSFEMAPLQYARYEALWEKVQEMGGATGDRVEVLLDLLACHIEKSAPRGAAEAAGSDSDPKEKSGGTASSAELPNTSGPAYQVNIHLDGETGLATVPTRQGDLVLSPAELEAAQCDCRVHRPDKRSVSTIGPVLRRKLLARDGHRCQRPGCGATRHLHGHHVVPRARGGSNDLENLITLCSGCHRLLHEGRWRLEPWARESA